MMVNHLRYQVLMPFIIVDSKSLPLSVDSLVDSCRSTTFGMLSNVTLVPALPRMEWLQIRLFRSRWMNGRRDRRKAGHQAG